MRPMYLLFAALLPTAAFAQARTVSAVAPETAMTAALSPAATAAVVPALHIAHLHETITTMVNPDFANPILDAEEAGISVTFGGPDFVTAPKLKKYSQMDIAQDVLPANGKAEVAVAVLVDRRGVPMNARVVHSAGADVDRAALAAVRSYRFAPATVDHQPVEAGVTVDVTIEK